MQEVDCTMASVNFLNMKMHQLAFTKSLWHPKYIAGHNVIDL